MKYIRTKDGRIFDYEPTHNIDVDGFVVQHINGWSKPLMKKDIIKIADTIEELCDAFVSICEDNFPEILVPKYISPSDTLITAWKNRFEDEMCYKDVIIKGAIWTDKGLIYVAKMNDKGELELI